MDNQGVLVEDILPQELAACGQTLEVVQQI